MHVDGAAASFGGRKAQHDLGQGSIAGGNLPPDRGIADMDRVGGLRVQHYRGAALQTPPPPAPLLSPKLLTILSTWSHCVTQGSNSRKEAQPQGQSNGPAAEMIDTNAPRGE